MSTDTAALATLNAALKSVNYTYDGVQELLGDGPFDAMARDQVVPGVYRIGQVLGSAKGMTAHGAMPLQQAIMAATAPMLIQKAVVDGDIEHGVMATGVVGGRIKELPSCEELVARIMAEAEARLAALTAA